MFQLFLNRLVDAMQYIRQKKHAKGSAGNEIFRNFAQLTDALARQKMLYTEEPSNSLISAILQNTSILTNNNYFQMFLNEFASDGVQLRQRLNELADAGRDALLNDRAHQIRADITINCPVNATTVQLDTRNRLDMRDWLQVPIGTTVNFSQNGTQTIADVSNTTLFTIDHSKSNDVINIEGCENDLIVSSAAQVASRSEVIINPDYIAPNCSVAPQSDAINNYDCNNAEADIPAGKFGYGDINVKQVTDGTLVTTPFNTKITLGVVPILPKTTITTTSLVEVLSEQSIQLQYQHPFQIDACQEIYPVTFPLAEQADSYTQHIYPLGYPNYPQIKGSFDPLDDGDFHIGHADAGCTKKICESIAFPADMIVIADHREQPKSFEFPVGFLKNPFKDISDKQRIALRISSKTQIGAPTFTAAGPSYTFFNPNLLEIYYGQAYVNTSLNFIFPMPTDFRNTFAKTEFIWSLSHGNHGVRKHIDKMFFGYQQNLTAPLIKGEQYPLQAFPDNVGYVDLAQFAPLPLASCELYKDNYSAYVAVAGTNYPVSCQNNSQTLLVPLNWPWDQPSLSVVGRGIANYPAVGMRFDSQALYSVDVKPLAASSTVPAFIGYGAVVISGLVMLGQGIRKCMSKSEPGVDIENPAEPEMKKASCFGTLHNFFSSKQPTSKVARPTESTSLLEAAVQEDGGRPPRRRPMAN